MPTTKKPPAPPAPRLRPRRRPILRVVGAENLPPRHAVPVNISEIAPMTMGGIFIVEIFTIAEWDQLPRALKCEKGAFVPGVGWLACRAPVSYAEVHDLDDMREQAEAAWFDR